VAYAHIYNQSISGATILFPTNTLGKEYYSINFTQRSNEDKSNSWFYVIATDTGTTSVEITPSANTINHPAGIPFTINLTQGQVFFLMGELTGTTGGGGGPGGGGNIIYNGVDLTGSKIKSIASGTGVCKRIAVFSGSGKMFISCDGNNSSSDNYMVQSFPKDAWGKKFLTVPTKNQNNNYYRICVQDPATIVTVNGAPIAFPLVGNFYYELPISANLYRIESDKPITVAQYIASQGECGNPFGNANPGDPEVIYLSPVEQNIAKVLWNATPNFNITRHYYNVVIPNTGTAISSFKLDGIVVNPALFIVHPQDSRFSYLSEQLTIAGVHSIESDSGFNAIAYGYGSAESYGYNAGTNIRDLYNFLEPLNPFSISPDPVACTGTPVYLSVTFPFQPTSLIWNFYANPIQSPNNNVTVNVPVADSTYFIGDKQVWRYKLPTLYNFNLANSNPGYLITITAGTTSTEGCGSSVDRDFYLAVYDPPIAGADWQFTGCVTDSIRFRDTTNYLAGTYSYKWFWDFGDGTRDSVRNPVHKYQTAGTYTVKFSMLSNVGCFSDTAYRTIVVTDVPNVSFSNSNPLCVGTPVTFTSSSSVNPPGNIQKWNWDFGDGSTQVITAPTNPTVSHTYPAFGTYPVNLWVETNSGCKSSRDTQSIYIGSYPLASFSVPAVVCLPFDSARFTNTSSVVDNPSNPLSHVWTFGDPASGINDTSLLTNPAHLYNNIGPYQVRLTTTTLQGCKDDTLIIFNNVYARADAEFNYTPENCLNDSSIFNSVSIGSGRPVAEWFWDFGDGSPIGNGSRIAHMYLSSGTKTIKHWVRTDVGCYSDTSVHTIIVNPLPEAKLQWSGPFCEERDVNLQSVSVANAGNIVSCAWNLGDGTVFTSSNQLPFNHVFADASTYLVTLTVTTDKGCVSPLLDSNLVIHHKPVAGFIDPEVCLSDTYAQFTDTTSVGDGNIIFWSWDFDHASSGAQNFSNLQNPRHSYATIGTKNVKLIVESSFGCRDTVVQSFFVNGDIPDARLNVLNENRLCSNDSIAIQDVSTVNVGSVVKLDITWDLIGAPNVIYTDDLPDSGKIYKHLYPNFQTPATKTYRVRLRAYSGETCIDSIFRNIVVNASPDVSMANISDTCLYIDPFQITQATENSGLPGAFSFSGQGVNATGIYDPRSVGAGTYPVQALYTTNAGCKDSATRNIRIAIPPIADFGISNPTCERRTIVFTDSSTSVSETINSWDWNFGDGTNVVSSNSNPVSHTYSNAGVYPVNLVVTTNQGCKSLPAQISNTVYPEPVASFRYTDTACLPNASIRFSNQSSIADNTQSGFRYSWNFGNPASGTLNSSIAINPVHVYSNLGPYPVRLVVTSARGCVDDTLIQVNTIHPQPDADFTFNHPSICEGDNVRLIDQSNFADGTPQSWNWNLGDNTNANVSSPVHNYPEPDTYSVSLFVTNSFGCVSDTTRKPFVVHPFPTADAGPDLLILEGQSAPFQSSASGTNLQFLWTPGTFLLNQNILQAVCKPTEDTRYTLTVTGIGGCSAIDQVFVKVLKTPLIPNTFSPNNDGINDYWEIAYLKNYPDAFVQIFSRTGQLVFQSRGYGSPWNGTKGGMPLPVDTYYYVIEPGSGREPMTGYVTIIK
jgi:gliding motility-associated-like protein